MSVKFIAETVLTAKDQSGAAFAAYAKNAQNATKHLQHLEKQQSHLAAMAQRAKQFAVVAGGALASVGAAKISQNMIGVSAKYEDLGAVLETLEGSSEKAKSSLAWIKNFTKETPYELQNTAEAFSRLRAYGINPMNGTMRTLGDTSAAMGKDIMAAVEMMADAIVGENERLKEFGVRGSAIKGTDLIEYSYKNKAGEQKTVQVNKFDQNQIRKTLEGIFSEKYLGAMEKRSKTFNGILSNMKDTISGLQGQFMDGGLFDMAKNNLQGKLDWLNRLSESGAVVRWGRNAANALRLVGDGLNYVSGLITHASSQLVAHAAKWDVVAEKLGVSTERINKIKGAIGDAKNLLANLWNDQPADNAGSWLKNLTKSKDTTAMSSLLEQLRTINKGDTLWGISKEVTGLGSKFGEIAKLNQGIIKDANKIKIGQQIKVSPAVSKMPDWMRSKKPITGEMSVIPNLSPVTAQLEKNANTLQQYPKWLETINDLSVKAFDFNLLTRYSSAVQWAGNLYTNIASELKTAFNTLKTNGLAAFNAISSWVNDDGKQAANWLSNFALSALPLLISTPLKIMAVVSSKLPALINQAREKLPLLGSQIANITSSLTKWAGLKLDLFLNPKSIQRNPFEKQAKTETWIEKLNAMAKDGRLNAWLDNAYTKLAEVAKNTAAFAAGIWAFGESAKNAIVWAKDLVGGWENLGKVAAGLYVFTKLGGFFQALDGFTGTIRNVGAIALKAGQGFLWLGKALGVGKLFGALANGARIIAPILLAAGRAALFTGAAFLASPIGLVLGGIAIAATAVYYNWDKLVNLWNNSDLKKQVMPIATAALDYAQEKWEQLKNWWDNTTLSQKAIDILTKPLEWAWSLAKDFFGWWATTEIGQKTASVISDSINIALDAAQKFANWWNNEFTLKNISASISTTASKIGENLSAAGNRIFGYKASDEAMSNAEFGGGRAIGGTVTAGTMYPVLERQSEIFSAAGKHYFMARENGVISTLDQFRRNQGIQSQMQAQTVKPFIAPTLGQQTGRVDAAITVRVEASEGLRVTNTGTETRKQGSLIRNVGVSMAA